MLKNISNCVQDNICCGCGACVNACPVDAVSYGEDQYGFIVPELDMGKCLNCRKCVQVCPALKQTSNKTIAAYAGVNQNNDVLIQSSSGGIFTEIAKYILDLGGTVFGCTMNDSLKVKHIKIKSSEELKRITKSKYVQSYMGDIYTDIKSELDMNKKVLFCGTPCQVSAVKNYVGEKSLESLVTVDIVCHGVPSQRFFDDYVDNLKKENKKELIFYAFRYKKNGKQGMNWHSAYQFSGKSKMIIKNWPEDSFNYLYMTSAIYRESCYNCKYAKSERVGDITLCDYWGWSKHHTEFTYKDSVSAILVNSDKGNYIIKKIAGNDVFLVETDAEMIRNNNGCLKAPVVRNKLRDVILGEWKQHGYGVIEKQFKSTHRKQILKYSLMRHIPKKVILWLKKW